MGNFSAFWDSKDKHIGLLYFQYCSYAETPLIIEKNLFTKKERDMYKKNRYKGMGLLYGIYEQTDSFLSYIERLTGLFGNDHEGMEHHFDTHYPGVPMVLAKKEDYYPGKPQDKTEKELAEQTEYLKAHPGHYWIEESVRSYNMKGEPNIQERFVYYSDGKRIASKVSWHNCFSYEFMRKYDFVGRTECSFYGSDSFLESIKEKFESGIFDDLGLQSVLFNENDNDPKDDDSLEKEEQEKETA